MYNETKPSTRVIGSASQEVSAVEASMNQLQISQEELHACIGALEERLDVVLSPPPPPPPPPENDAKEHLCGAPLWRAIEERTRAARVAASRISRIIERLAI